MKNPETSVIVVGAGPVGAALACCLWRNDVRCRIIDAESGPTPPHESRALGIHARTLEVFDDLGMVESILAQGRKLQALSAYDDGQQFARLELDFDALATSYPVIISLPQGETQRQLIVMLEKHGGHVEWQSRLTALRQEGDCVTATVERSDGRQEQLRAAWLVGCDGASSTVRHQLQLSFAGAEYPEQFALADVRLDWQFDQQEGRLLVTGEGLVAALPLPEQGLWRLIDTTGTSRTEGSEAILHRFQNLLTAAGFPDARITAGLWTSSFKVHRRTVQQLRVGRCFLAGDAAHIHSPVGGQGMNTGIQDAYNLAWKLARVIKHPGAEPLLDSYQSERLPIAASVARSTDWATRIVTLQNPLARSARNHIVGWLTARRTFRQRLTRQLSELGVRYRSSPIVADDWNASSDPKLKPGDRVPDAALNPTPTGAQRLFDLLRGTHHTLLFFDGRDTPLHANQAEIAAIAELLASRSPEDFRAYHVVTAEENDARAPCDEPFTPVLDLAGELHGLFGATAASLYLVRPDGYLGYRAAPPAADRLAEYLTRVLG